MGILHTSSEKISDKCVTCAGRGKWTTRNVTIEAAYSSHNRPVHKNRAEAGGREGGGTSSSSVSSAGLSWALKCL